MFTTIHYLSPLKLFQAFVVCVVAALVRYNPLLTLSVALNMMVQSL